ncbi:MAG: tripartite tricarboxylate transporter substrate binding protein [Spirochaetaceae bacterium]|nr:tripartite tricarboxylate transporter substrate binding protein [Spirochaetaceae bacterium]MCF7948908.1 tripartite tricarboxylate transporter substrate binding protein [Spirochaetia bacterium]MCF7951083.1 tripartite tricarboxylate transporter substrate binding protein [Spirochaetaceae bacterium]
MKRMIFSAILVLFVAGFGFANGQTEEGADSYPSKTIEFVVPASPGGGSDTLGRLLTDIIQKNDLVDGNIVVVNKPGGASAVGQQYVLGRDGNYTLFTMNAAHALAARANSGIDSMKFTPVAAVAMDNVLFLTGADSGYRSIDDVVSAAKGKPNQLTVGVADNLDQLCVAQINKSAGIELKGVYYDSASESNAALLGGHIDFSIANPNECIGQVRSGDIVPLATFNNERLEAPFADAPTFQELGYSDVEFQMFRSVMGGAGMSEEVQKFWSDVFAQVVETEQWKTQYIEKKMLDPKFMPADEYGPYHRQAAKRLQQDAQDIGLFD